MSRLWNLHYPRWMIADGEPERRMGEDFDWFAVEFWTPGNLDPATHSDKLAVAIVDYK
jgi:hypothetical protein